MELKREYWKKGSEEKSDVPYFVACMSSTLIWDRVYIYTRIKVQYKHTVHYNKIEFVNKHLTCTKVMIGANKK
jgi:hypothetical protein